MNLNGVLELEVVIEEGNVTIFMGNNDLVSLNDTCVTLFAI
jgi:hypothetical protein